MPNKHLKKPCPDCGVSIEKRSERCPPCSRLFLRKYSSDRALSVKTYGYFRNRGFEQNLRSKVFEKLGNVCAQCGFSDLRALHIDHINNDGYVDRQLTGYSSPKKRYRLVLEDKDNRFQILCANCNYIKRHENLKQKIKDRYAGKRQTINTRITGQSRLAIVSGPRISQPGQPAGGAPVAQGQAPSGPPVGG